MEFTYRHYPEDTFRVDNRTRNAIRIAPEPTGEPFPQQHEVYQVEQEHEERPEVRFKTSHRL